MMKDIYEIANKLGIYAEHLPSKRQLLQKISDKLLSIDAELNELRQIATSGHQTPHFNYMGGCQCHCPQCLGPIKLYQLNNGPWFASRKCTCSDCTQECSSFDGRLALTAKQQEKDIIITAVDPG